MDEWQKKVAAMKAARQNRTKSPSVVGATPVKAASQPSSAASSSSSSSSGASSSASSSSAASSSSYSKSRAATAPSKPSAATAGATRASTTVKAPTAERTSSFGAGGLSPSSTRSPSRVSGVGAYKSSTSSSPASATSGSDFKALYEAEVEKRKKAEEQTATKEKECSMLKQKLVQLSGTDLAKQVVASGGSVSRELNLAKTELKVTKMKYDSEVRKREGLEREVARQKEEVASLKRKGSTARQMVDRSRKEMEMTSAKRKIDLKANRMKMQADRLVSERGLEPGGSKRMRQSVRQSKRMTRAPKTDIVAMVTRVLAEMEKLEKNIRTAEEGRMQAESELVEVAMYKQAADEALESIANDMRLQVVFLVQHITALRGVATNSQEKPAVEAVIAKLDKLRGDMEQRLMDKNVKKSSNDVVEINKRASVYASQMNLPPPPPTGIVVTSYGATRAGAPAPAAPSSLLDQIRKGKNLNRINVEALQAERQANYRSNRKSMALLTSLQDTLRDALNNRREDLEKEDFGDDDDDWEEWEEN